IRLCLARVVTPRLTRAMSRPPYFRPYGAQAFTRALSASARTSVPRFWRIYLALWLISRWRLPATPCLILPVAVSLKRFLTPLFVFILGILSPFAPTGATLSNGHGSPYWPGRSHFSNRLEVRAPKGKAPKRQPLVEEGADAGLVGDAPDRLAEQRCDAEAADLALGVVGFDRIDGVGHHQFAQLRRLDARRGPARQD